MNDHIQKRLSKTITSEKKRKFIRYEARKQALVRILFFGGLVLWFVVGLFSFQYVPSGKIGIYSVFGEINGKYALSGWHMKNPLWDTTFYKHGLFVKNGKRYKMNGKILPFLLKEGKIDGENMDKIIDDIIEDKINQEDLFGKGYILIKEIKNGIK
jgi:hypothetical protein